jgi:hypothetical protein
VDYRNIPTECANSHDGIARLSDENTVESLFLGFGAPVSFRPFLDRVQTALNNQYPLEFCALSRRRAGLKSIRGHRGVRCRIDAARRTRGASRPVRTTPNF